MGMESLCERCRWRYDCKKREVVDRINDLLSTFTDIEVGVTYCPNYEEEEELETPEERLIGRVFNAALLASMLDVMKSLKETRRGD